MRQQRRPRVWPIVLLALFGASGSALAQAPAGASAQPPDGATAAARAAHERGLDAREKGDWPAAYEAFLSAWGHKRHWEIAVNLGEAEMQLGKYEDAVEHLSFTLKEPGFLQRSPQLVQSETAQISAWIADAESKLRARRAAEVKVGSPPPRPWIWIAGAGAGLTTVSLVSGSILYAMAQSRVGEVNASLGTLPGQSGDPASVRCAGDASSTCRINRDRLRAADSMQSAGTGLFVTAGLVAAATAAAVVLWSDRRERGPVVAPVVSATGAGLSLSGAW